jgi:repressor LexA
MGVGDRIRALREERGWTQGELAVLLKFHHSTISDYERGKIEPPLRILERLAVLFNVTLSDLLELPRNIQPANEEAMIALPVYGPVQAGRPGFLAEVPEEGTRLIDASRVRGGDYRFLRVAGDSMEPQIPDGALVLMRLQPEVEHDEIAVVVVNDEAEATVKRVRYSPDRRTIILQPDNHKHSSLFLPTRDVRIIGRVEEVHYRPR